MMSEPIGEPNFRRKSSFDPQELSAPESTVDVVETRNNGNDHDDGPGQSYDMSEDLPPGRLHATTRAEIRLRSNLIGDGTASVGSSGSGGGGRRRKSIEYPLSPRSKSPSFARGGGATATTTDGNSSISSLEDLADSDILYDRYGLADSDVLSAASSAENKRNKTREFVNLTPVTERMTEDTLEDVHAFSDVKAPSHGGGGTGITIASSGSVDGDKALLDPLLEEGDEDDEEDDGEGNEDDDSLDDPYDSNAFPPVILTNIENLSLQAQEEEGSDAHAVTDAADATAESSLPV